MLISVIISPAQRIALYKSPLVSQKKSAKKPHLRPGADESENLAGARLVLKLPHFTTHRYTGGEWREIRISKYDAVLYQNEKATEFPNAVCIVPCRNTTCTAEGLG